MHRVILLDVRGLKCPLPALLARRTLARSVAGSAIEVLCDDPLAALDVPHMCRHEGYDVIKIDRQNGLIRLLLRRPL